ncbi:MAG: thiamine pyrophosphate-dependent enzyme [Spirochaetia bacterium]|nr:thiamine pyrophosphate-dependent enzyme [Spirochaetia bacterium]
MVEKKLLSGDEAIALGAYEAGVACGFGYPGTPSTEILEAFATFKDVYAEWSINEKVALENATGVSLAGSRSIVTMKHVGLNVALDAFMTLAYTGINGGLVVASADDPGMHSSQNEQDNRYLGKFANVPVIEPSDSSEARTFTKQAFEISERFDLPVLLRITTRTAHSGSIVEFDLSNKPVKPKKKMDIPWDKYVMMPLNAKKRRVVLVKKQEELRAFAEITELNHEDAGETDIGFITSGVSYQYVREAFPGKAVFKLGLLNPLPLKRIDSFVSRVKKVYVVEEVEPYIEDYLNAAGIKVEGKSKIPLIDELNPDIVRSGILGTKQSNTLEAVKTPGRPPQLCPDCGHRGVFKVLNELKLTVAGDIGCYTLGALPPFSAMHTCIDMGSSINHAYGIIKAGEPSDKVVAVIGDSTFMHSGITGIANAVYNNGSMLTIILDNRTTAMTGRQPHAAAGDTLQGAPGHNVDIEALLHALGVMDVAVVDPFDGKNLKSLVEEYLKKQGVRVIIARRPCALMVKHG